MNEHLPRERSAEPSAEQLAQLDDLCWYAGIPSLSVSARCAAKIFPERTPPDRRLHDLIWVARTAIFGLMPAQQTLGGGVEIYLIRFTTPSGQGEPESHEVALVETPSSTGQPRYELCLLDEVTAPSLNRPVVLVVEDEPIVADVERLLLEAAGFAVLHAKNGRDGLDLARDKHPAAIILDLDLPDLCGSVVCHQLKSSHATRDIPVVICSGHPQARAIARDVGADGCVAKPGEVSHLPERVRQLLSSQGQTEA